MPLFHRYIGIDCSGAGAPSAPLQGLQVFVADRGEGACAAGVPPSQDRKWDRQRLASWLLERLR